MMGQSEGVMRLLFHIFALVLSLCAVAGAQSFDVHGSGRHTLAGNDSAATAGRRQQQDPGTIAEFRAAIRINPKYVDGHNNLGIARTQRNKERARSFIKAFEEP
jgi:hypothetical protein